MSKTTTAGGDFTHVTPTQAEIDDYVRRNGRRPSQYRVACAYCGTRIWGSGLGIGSHRRACSYMSKMQPVALDVHVVLGVMPGDDEVVSIPNPTHARIRAYVLARATARAIARGDDPSSFEWTTARDGSVILDLFTGTDDERIACGFARYDVKGRK